MMYDISRDSGRPFNYWKLNNVLRVQTVREIFWVNEQWYQSQRLRTGTQSRPGLKQSAAVSHNMVQHPAVLGCTMDHNARD